MGNRFNDPAEKFLAGRGDSFRSRLKRSLEDADGLIADILSRLSQAHARAVVEGGQAAQVQGKASRAVIALRAVARGLGLNPDQRRVRRAGGESPESR